MYKEDALGKVVVNIVSSYGEHQSISWYRGTRATTIVGCVRTAFQTPDDGTLSLLDEAGTDVDLHEVDTGAELRLEVTFPQHELVLQAYDLASARHSQDAAMGSWTPDAADSSTSSSPINESQPLLTSKSFWTGSQTAERLRVRRFGDPPPAKSVPAWPDAPKAREVMHSWLGTQRINAHLANERTYLAWSRVSLKVLVLGLLTVTMSLDPGSALTKALFGGLGGMCVCLAPYTLYFGASRYYQVKEAMMRGVHECFSVFRDDLTHVAVALGAVVATVTTVMCVQAWGFWV